MNTETVRVPTEKLIDRISFSECTVSPNGARVSYVNVEGAAVVDGEEGKRYDSIQGLIFSPDSVRVAYVAWEGRGRLKSDYFVVVDGKEGKRYDDIYVDAGIGVIFSPDSAHVAYVAREDAKRFVMCSS